MIYEENGTYYGRRRQIVESITGWQFFAFEYVGYGSYNSTSNKFALSYYNGLDQFIRTQYGGNYGTYPSYASNYTNIGSMTKDGNDFDNVLEGLVSQFYIYQRESNVNNEWVTDFTSDVKTMGSYYNYNWIMTDISKNFLNSNIPNHICTY